MACNCKKNHGGAGIGGSKPKDTSKMEMPKKEEELKKEEPKEETK